MLDLLPGAHVTTYELVIGAGTLLLGIASVASFCTVLVRDAHRRRRARTVPPPKDDPRWRTESIPQRVGRPCACCGRVVRLEPDAATCEACGDVCHVACVARHAARAHAPAPNPFR